MSPVTPSISVILCTYNRASLLRQALKALCTQTLSVTDFEIILIDDGSTDDSPKVVQAFQKLLPIQYIYQRNSGLAAAKNCGIASSSAPIVLFADDDDIMGADCLRQHVQTHRNHPQPHFAVLGHTDLLPDVARSPLMHYVTQINGLLFCYAPLQHGEILDYHHFWGGRSSCKRALLNEHGVFNPIFRFGAEDIELGYRLSAAGLKVIYNQRAISHMARTLSFKDFCRRSYLQGQSNRSFFEIHPTPEVNDYTQTEQSSCEWPEIQTCYPRILKTAANLHRLAAARSAAELPNDGLTLCLLHSAYQAAFRASRIKGTAEPTTSHENSNEAKPRH